MDPVQEQVEAFNAHDLDRFLACYAPDVVIEDGAGNVMMQGHDGMRRFYEPVFAQSPHLHADIVTRIRVGAYVIDEERGTGLNAEGFPPEMHAVVIYRVEGDKIVHARALM
jgi:uncharacterized protein (TIGR02246 family)